MTLEELGHRMTHREFLLWAAFYGAEPWGDARADLNAAQVCSILANCHSPKARFRASDFLPDWEDSFREPQSEDQMKAILMRMAGVATGDGAGRNG